MNENRPPEIRWLDSPDEQETGIRFVGRVRLHNPTQMKTNKEAGRKPRYSKKLCLACLVFAGLTIAAIGLMSGGNLFAHNANDDSPAAPDARVGWITPPPSDSKTDIALVKVESSDPLPAAVIGINTAIASRGGGNDGVGFAVPVNWPNGLRTN